MLGKVASLKGALGKDTDGLHVPFQLSLAHLSSFGLAARHFLLKQ